MREAPDNEQREAWRRRIVEAVLARTFDDETLAEMLMAGFEEAHAEGLLDAAEICGDVADGSPPNSGVARVLESALRSLVEMNAMQVPAPQYPAQFDCPSWPKTMPDRRGFCWAWDLPKSPEIASRAYPLLTRCLEPNRLNSVRY